jgi:hypothetical protein
VRDDSGKLSSSLQLLETTPLRRAVYTFSFLKRQPADARVNATSVIGIELG